MTSPPGITRRQRAGGPRLRKRRPSRPRRRQRDGDPDGVRSWRCIGAGGPLPSAWSSPPGRATRSYQGRSTRTAPLVRVIGAAPQGHPLPRQACPDCRKCCARLRCSRATIRAGGTGSGFPANRKPDARRSNVEVAAGIRAMALSTTSRCYGSGLGWAVGAPAITGSQVTTCFPSTGYPSAGSTSKRNFSRWRLSGGGSFRKSPTRAAHSEGVL